MFHSSSFVTTTPSNIEVRVLPPPPSVPERWYTPVGEIERWFPDILTYDPDEPPSTHASVPDSRWRRSGGREVEGFERLGQRAVLVGAADAERAVHEHRQRIFSTPEGNYDSSCSSRSSTTATSAFGTSRSRTSPSTRYVGPETLRAPMTAPLDPWTAFPTLRIPSV